MTKVPTTDVARCVWQIRRLAAAGCGLVRVAVPLAADTAALARIVGKVPVGLVADVHYSPARAIEAIEAGAVKIRLNPGNIKDRKKINRVIDAARASGTAIRIGVNEASIRDLGRGDVATARRVDLMLRELTGYIKIFEKRRFCNLVISAKSSDTVRTIEVNRRMAGAFDYPIHLGLTHAGLYADALLPSAVCIGSLLSEGIGDTIRVSIAGSSLLEVRVAERILQSLGMRPSEGPQLVVCPTCGRTACNVVSLAKRIGKALKHFNGQVKVAVMGCVVNGPGEAADADVAVCAAAGKAYIYSGGRRVATVPESQAELALLKELKKL